MVKSSCTSAVEVEADRLSAHVNYVVIRRASQMRLLIHRVNA